jgi:hypothetical protein
MPDMPWLWKSSIRKDRFCKRKNSRKKAWCKKYEEAFGSKAITLN